MPTFAFTARSTHGKTVKGLRLLDSEGALALALASEGLFLIRAEPAPPGNPSRRRLRWSTKEYATFLLHLAAYLEVGLSLLDALREYRNPARPRLEQAVLDMGTRLTGGASLSEVMAAYTLFQPIHVAMIRAGEASGRLTEALRAVLALVEWDDAFRAQVRQAATYPLIVLGVLALIGLLVSKLSLPTILMLLESLQIPLPLVTRIFLQIGTLLTRFGWLLVAVPLGFWLGLKQALLRPSLRLRWDGALLALPGLGPLLTRIALSRFAHVLAEQYRSGIPLVQALRQCEEVTGNARMAQHIRSLADGVEQGERLAVTAARIDVLPPLIVRMLAIGEETGHLEETLRKAIKYFDAEVAEAVRLFFQGVDPLLKVLLAGVLVFVACAILLPLYLLIGGING